MTDLYVVVEPNVDQPEAVPWVYGIFNNRDEAERFVVWATQDDEFGNEDEYKIVKVTPAWAGGLLCL